MDKELYHLVNLSPRGSWLKWSMDQICHKVFFVTRYLLVAQLNAFYSQ